MRTLYDKSRLGFAIVWIIVYCAMMSVGDAVSEIIGISKSVSLLVGLLLSAILIVFLKKHELLDAYGLCAPKASLKKMLYYVPVIIMLTANLWYGVRLNFGVVETVLYILTMFCVGFLEEIIFRGLLFEAMRKDSVRAAVIVSSVTFGVGHIVNLVNGSGAQLLPNMLQVIYATAAGFMFVMMYYRSKSLWTCIIAHGLFNAISVFSNNEVGEEMQIVSAIMLTVITGSYAIYLAIGNKRDKDFEC